jgi:threonine/homoserine/homoserine lactone efflux protein
MVLLVLFIKGLVIGFSLAAPVGPIGILCINRTLQQGWPSGVMTGAGAALADGIFGIVAGFGLTFISGFIAGHQFWIRTIGGIFLLFLGIRILRTKFSAQLTFRISAQNLIRDFTSSFILTLTNPVTIFSFMAIFAGLGLGSLNTSYLGASILIIGIVLGSLLWWLILSFVVSKFLHGKVDRSALYWMSRTSGVIIMLFGLAALTTVIWRFFILDSL